MKLPDLEKSSSRFYRNTCVIRHRQRHLFLERHSTCKTSVALIDLKTVLKLINVNLKADPAQTPGYVLQQHNQIICKKLNLATVFLHVKKITKCCHGIICINKAHKKLMPRTMTCRTAVVSPKLFTRLESERKTFRKFTITKSRN